MTGRAVGRMGMNKKLLSGKAYNLNNAALEGAIEDYIESQKDPKKLEILVNLFKGAQVIVPVSFPKNANKASVMRLLQGIPLKKGDTVPMIPMTVRDQDGNMFAPVFTSRDQIGNTEDFPYMIRVDAAQVIKNCQNEKNDLIGVIINPQEKGFIIRNKAFDMDFSKPQQQIKKVSKEEFAVLARNSVEKSLIPTRLFEEKGAFIEELEERGEELLSEMYAKPYGDKVPSIFTPEDFSVMSLSIDDETTAICIELPVKGMAVGIGISAYVIWYPETEEAYYYLIERGERGQSNVLCSVTPEGEHQELMTAPPTGSELTAVLELIAEEKEEA